MLKTLALQHIRSYQNGLFEFSDGVNIIVGPNASGKTNLLEAIHVICLGGSFKSSDEHLVHRDSDWGRIDATTDEETRIVKLQRSPLQKLVVLNDKELKRLSIQSAQPVVLFEPEHMLMLSSEPDRRRSYVDEVLKQTLPNYNATATKYRRVLAQRNRLLKKETLTPEELFVWDMQLCELAGAIVQARQEYIAQANKQLTKRYRSVSGNKENLQLHYESRIEQENYANELARALKESFELDRQRGFTGVGPHRDDIKVLLDEQDAKINASRGEVRSIVLALKITELELIQKSRNKAPVLLLDDVFSELDGRRRQMLAKTLQDYQTFITTTDADVVLEHFQSTNIIPVTRL